MGTTKWSMVAEHRFHRVGVAGKFKTSVYRDKVWNRRTWAHGELMGEKKGVMLGGTNWVTWAVR